MKDWCVEMCAVVFGPEVGFPLGGAREQRARDDSNKDQKEKISHHDEEKIGRENTKAAYEKVWTRTIPEKRFGIRTIRLPLVVHNGKAVWWKKERKNQIG